GDPSRHHRLEHLEAPEVRTQALRHADRAVGLLVVLEDRDDPARRAERAVERRDGARLVLAVDLDALAHVEAARLERRAVRRRRELEVALLRGQPRLAVELARGARPEVARGGVDDAVRQVDETQHLLLPAEQALVLRLGVRRVAVGEHLDLVELVHADDAAHVLAVRAGLAAVARAPAGVAQRPGRQVDDLVRVVARERHLARPDEVEVVLLEAVDLVRVGAEEPGALHDLGPHERRRDDRREPGRDRRVHRGVEQRELEARAHAREVVEPGARHLGATLGVDRAQPLAEVEVVAGREALRGEVADRPLLAQHDVVVLAAGGRARDDVRDAVQQPAQLLRRGVGVGLARLDVGRELLGAREQLLLLLPLRLGDLLAEGLLLGAQALELAQRGAVAGVGVEGGVHQRGVVTTGDLAGTDDVGGVAQEAEVDHASSLTNCALRGRSPFPPRPRYGVAMSWTLWLAIAALAVAVVALVVALGLRAQQTRQRRVHGDAPPAGEAPVEDDPRELVAFVANPSKPDVAGLETVVRAAFADAALPDPLWFETTVEDPGVGQTRAALAQGADVVVAVGGDGTVRAVAEGMVGSGRTMGLVPVGTGNLLARNLDLPVGDARAALAVVIAGTDRPVDVGWATVLRWAEDPDGAEGAEPGSTRDVRKEHIFLVIAGLGFDAAMVADTDDDLKAKVGWVAYFVAGI